MEYHPTGFVEKFGNLFLTVRHRVRKDLRLFKHHIELDGGAWTEDEDGRSDEGDLERDGKGRVRKKSQSSKKDESARDDSEQEGEASQEDSKGADRDSGGDDGEAGVSGESGSRKRTASKRSTSPE